MEDAENPDLEILGCDMGKTELNRESCLTPRNFD